MTSHTPPEHGAKLMADLGWWCIHGETLLDMLREVADGGDPGLVYAEHYVNSDREDYSE